MAGGTSPERMAAEGEPEAPPYGSVPVAPSLAWTDVKLDEVKDFMKIHEVSACLPPRCFQHSPAPRSSMRPARVTVPADPESAQRHQPDAALAFVAGKFGLADYETNAKSAILVDFYLWILMFCKERGFTEEKTSAAFTIVRLTHEFAVDGIKTVQDAFGEFKRLVLKHSLVGVKDSVVDSLPASGRMHVRSRSFFLFRDLCRPLAVFALPKLMYACMHVCANI